MRFDFMLIGHFAVGMCAKKASPSVNLAVFFIAALFVDLIFPIFVLLDIEHVSIDHSITPVVPFNLSHYPYSHSLLMSVVYSLLAFILCTKWFKSKKISFIVGLSIFSHWILDFITHVPDLPITFGDYKVGLGLWNSIWGTIIIEGSLFIIGVYFYLKSKPGFNKKRNIIFWSMISLLLVAYFWGIFGPKPPENIPESAIAWAGFSIWIIVIMGYFADKKETSKLT